MSRSQREAYEESHGLSKCILATAGSVFTDGSPRVGVEPELINRLDKHVRKSLKKEDKGGSHTEYTDDDGYSTVESTSTRHIGRRGDDAPPPRGSLDEYFHGVPLENPPPWGQGARPPSVAARGGAQPPQTQRPPSVVCGPAQPAPQQPAQRPPSVVSNSRRAAQPAPRQPAQRPPSVVSNSRRAAQPTPRQPAQRPSSVVSHSRRAAQPTPQQPAQRPSSVEEPPELSPRNQHGQLLIMGPRPESSAGRSRGRRQ